VKALVIGSGGREHTIAWKLRQSPLVDSLYCAPGNPGTASIATNVPVGSDDIEALLDFARSEEIDLTMVGPEAPLADGIVDAFEEAGLMAAGPSRAAAQLEGSKVFAKDFMARHHIPTAEYEVYDDDDDAELDLRQRRFKFPVVLKADGLAAGKGVIICADLAEAIDALNSIMRERDFGSAGHRLVIEEFLRGEEASFMVFTDGIRILPMVPSQDHKAAYERDLGPNTGGMGAYSTDNILSQDLKEEVLDTIIEPTIRGMAAEGNPYRGILYAGLMLTSRGPKVLEFNVRFGDPETQAVLPRLKSDLFEILHGVAKGDLSGQTAEWAKEAVVCVVLASEGYPGHYDKGFEISGLDLASEIEDTIIFHAGTSASGDRVVTNGGRVLGVTAQAPSLEAAIMQAYEGVNKISFEGKYYRRDIAAKGLNREKKG